MINLTIVTPERTVYNDSIDQVTLPTEQGEITVMSNHIPLVSVVNPGELVIKTGSITLPFAISGGFVQVNENQIIILADTAERAEEIAEDRAEEARLRAQQARDEKRFDTEEFAILSAKIEKELARIRVAKKYRHKGHAGLTEPELVEINQ